MTADSEATRTPDSGLARTRDVAPSRTTSGQLDLEDRHALRRVAGLSTELQDVSEVEYRALRLERVVLMGVWTEGTLATAENSLRELSPAGRDRGLGGTGRPDPAPRPAGLVDLRGRGQGRRARRPRRGDRRRHGDLRRRADPRPAAQAGGHRQGQGRRPDRADPGHLRPARPQQGGQGPGRAGPAAVPAAPAARLGRVAVPAGRRPGGRRRRHRHPRSGRDEDRDRPAPDPDADRQAAPRDRRDVGRPAGAARPAPAPRGAVGGDRRVHQRREVQPAEPADRGAGPGGRLAVRHARPGRAPGAGAVGRLAVHADRHRRASSGTCRISWWTRSGPRWRRWPTPT